MVYISIDRFLVLVHRELAIGETIISDDGIVGAQDEVALLVLRHTIDVVVGKTTVVLV